MKFLSRSLTASLILATLRGFCRAIPVFAIGLLLLSGLDAKMSLVSWGRQLLWAVFVLAAIERFISSFRPWSMFSLSERSKNLAMRKPTLRSDDLRIAAEFSQSSVSDGISTELKDAFTASIEEQLKSCSPFWGFPRWRWQKPVMMVALSFFMVGSLRAFFPAAFPLEQRLLFPFWWSAIDQDIKVEPGDAEVPSGSDVPLELTLLTPGASKPIMMVRSGDEWVELIPTAETPTHFSYLVKKVVSPLTYKIQWRGSWTRKYKLTPIEPFSISKFQIKIKPPEYTGKAVIEQTSPEITGLAGSVVDMTIETTQPIEKLSLVFSDAREIAADNVKDKEAHFRFTLDKSANYGFPAALYPIHVTPDTPPTITLLAPDQDIVVGEKEKLPITFEAKDDYGLGEISLRWEIQNGKSGRLQIRHFDAGTENSLSTYEWNLSDQRFAQGQVIRFRLEVSDLNRVTGPGEGQSEWRVIEIRSFELEHAVLEKALQTWRDKAVETLASVTTLDKKLQAENADMNALTPELAAATQKMNQLEEGLKQIVNKMEQDPLADYGVWLEHKEMQENLSALNQSAMRNAQAAFQTQNKPAASANLQNVANELERMSALSEDLSKNQNARDLMTSGENLEKIGEDISSALEKGNIDPETMAKINQLVSEAQKNLAEMARSLQQMPEDLPEDFVNQEALKNINPAKSQDILNEISEAVKNGDAKKALELAKKFLDSAKAMREKLSKAHDSFMNEHSASELEKKIKAQQEALQAVADDQRALLAQTQTAASKELDQVMRQQESFLADLLKRQQSVIDNSKTVLNESKSPVMMYLSALMQPMSTVAEEFRAKRVEKSPELLNGIASQLGMIETELSKSSATLAQGLSVQKSKQEEIEILSMIKNPPSFTPDPKSLDQKKYQELGQRQQEIRKKLQGVHQELQLLSRKTASLGGELMQALGNAGNEMKEASESLSGNNGLKAQSHEENALDQLLQGDAQLQQALSAMDEMSSEQGEGQGESGEGGSQQHGKGGPKVILRGGGGGKRGESQLGKVRLPNAEDYRPPKAFREDLLESLKENYPKIYEEIIHEYYKRLAQ